MFGSNLHFRSKLREPCDLLRHLSLTYRGGKDSIQLEIDRALLLVRLTLMEKELVLLGHGHKDRAGASTYSCRKHEPMNIVWQCFSYTQSGSIGYTLMPFLFTCTSNVE
jgi:hypothetical protein